MATKRPTTRRLLWIRVPIGVFAVGLAATALQGCGESELSAGVPTQTTIASAPESALARVDDKSCPFDRSLLVSTLALD